MRKKDRSITERGVEGKKEILGLEKEPRTIAEKMKKKDEKG